VFDQRTQDVVIAFQRHFRQANLDGCADPETMEVLRLLLGKLDAP
jgi:N-acetylmuramoyl-L-alanine amidase